MPSKPSVPAKPDIKLIGIKTGGQLSAPFLLAFAGLFILVAFVPADQSSGDPGQQTPLWTGATITTTAQSQVVACGQGSGAVGRKTLVVHNAAGSDGAVTVTVDLRDGQTTPNFTSGFMALNGVADDAITYTTVAATGDAGRFCQVSAVSASTSTITATLRRE
jgi:hypothetical protein